MGYFVSNVAARNYCICPLYRTVCACPQDIEGLASKILESMYGNTVMFSSRGQRTVKVTLNVRQSSKPDSAPSSWSRERKGKSSADKLQDYYGVDEIDGAAPAEHRQRRSSSPVYGDAEPLSPHRHHRVKSGAQVYRRDQLVEMVEKSLAENLSFQNTRYEKIKIDNPLCMQINLYTDVLGLPNLVDTRM